MKTFVLDTQISREGQNAYFTQLLEAHPNGQMVKLKIEIKTDSVSRQAYARVSKFNGEEWKLLATLLELKTPLNLAYCPDGQKEKDFEEDRQRLINAAKNILT